MNVLVVDDHTLVRDGIELLLAQLGSGFESVGVGTIDAALQHLRDTPGVDLILLDLQLPGTSGMDGLDQLRNHHPDVPVVVVSGRCDKATVLESIKKGAMGFIPKTYSGSLMVGALEYVVRHKGIHLPCEVFLDQAGPAVQPPASTPHEGEMTTPEAIGLTARQAEVLRLILEGKPNKLIARALSISEATVKSHLSAVLRSLNVTTRTGAVIAANRLRLVFPAATRPSTPP
ncbi:MAG: response regulator transcription factor [Burkholderiaceae bacterium]|nr:response regulator transcription factor [Burkholderiaceae bacterium]